MTLQRLPCALLALAAITPVSAAGAWNRSRTVAFVNVHVVPMDRERALPGQTVLVRGERIAAIGPATTVKIPAGALRIDGRGKYLMPGLADMHVHLLNSEDLLLCIANGVTTVRDMDGQPVHLLWRKKIAAKQLLGPTLYTSSPIIANVTDAEEGRRLVNRYAAAGYDYIKVHWGIGREAYKAITAAARASGLPVVGHIPEAVGLDGVLAARQRSIEHAQEFAQGPFQSKSDTADAELERAARAVREAGVWVCPTLIQAGGRIQEFERLYHSRSRPELRFLSPVTQEGWQRFYSRRNFPASLEPVYRQGWAFQKRITGALHREKVKTLLGTDAASQGTVPGFCALDELRLLVETGYTPFEALQAATRSPAEFCSAPGEFGTVSAGARADLLLVDGDPLRDVGNVAKRTGVMVRGRWFPEARLRAMLDALPAHYRAVERRLKAQLATRPMSALKVLAESSASTSLLEHLLTQIVVERGFGVFQRIHAAVLRRDPAAALVREETIDDVASDLLRKGRSKEGIAVLTLNAGTYPRSATAHCSLADAYLQSGQTSRAIEQCRKALAIDPSFSRAKEMLKRLGVNDEAPSRPLKAGKQSGILGSGGKQLWPSQRRNG